MAKRRLAVIKKIYKPQNTQKPQSLLDIGCAYGPFLAAASEEGFSPFGIDPAQDAVRYVQKELGIPASCGFFPDCGFPSSPPYDAITLWYVIEHFKDCAPVLAEIRKVLKDGGILAFSTPSFSGISGRASLRRFLSASPQDHFTVWSPKTCKKALALTGFKVKKTVISGHHPERFPLLGKFAKNKNGVLYILLLAISRIFGLGDTFEVYAQVKKTEKI
ncbi:MAG: class I SAM-dependent methyltransferase [Treponema sp.]|jgi:2-polyprenyl-3-methyl-5-hydroxy-6-metoxy-1,4-benzoquinol methylase|nr:class I SAM-dependent methyltransferase [Treponema sp.]